MNKNYTLALLFCIIFFFGCSKDFLKSYEDRIVGTWKVTDVDRIGIGGNTDKLPFTSGTFTFNENGTLNYLNPANENFKGSWEIVKKVVNEETFRSLQITAIDFTNQQILTEYYDEMIFTSSDHFKSTKISGFHSYVTHFRK